MTITSTMRHGLIYAGDTHLVSTIAIEQTAPMQLTVRAGSFTTTGQSRIVEVNSDNLIGLIRLVEQEKAEWIIPSERARVWLTRSDGSLVEKSQTFTLAADAVFNLTSDPVDVKAYQAELGVQAGVVDVLIRSRFAQDTYPDAPIGWQKIHDIIFEFSVPPGTVDLSGLDIYVLSVLPGFPPGTDAADWLTQSGSV